MGTSNDVKLKLKNDRVYLIDAGTEVSKYMNIIIRVEDLIKSKVCISSERGEKLYEAIISAVRMGKKTYVSFDGITCISSAFLDSAIGELYNGEFSKKELKEKISIIGLKEDDLFIMRRVAERAEEFFKNPQKIESLFEYDNY
jgi:small nuclear ribonucleoprotein (snRNP)-like protein